jgi:hypothetical protein
MGALPPFERGDGFLRLRCRRGRVAAWERRARCGVTTRNVIDGQSAVWSSTVGPATQRGPERRPCVAEQKRFEEPPRRACNGRPHHGIGPSPNAGRPAVASLRQRSPKQSRSTELSRCTWLPSASLSARSPPTFSPRPTHKLIGLIGGNLPSTRGMGATIRASLPGLHSYGSVRRMLRLLRTKRGPIR